MVHLSSVFSTGLNHQLKERKKKWFSALWDFSRFIAQYLIIKKWASHPFLTINLFCWCLKRLIGPTAVRYVLSALWKTEHTEIHLATRPRQLIDTQTKLRELQSAALIDGRTWKVACLFPLWDYSIKPRPVRLAGINMHGDSLSPLFLHFCVKRHSLSVFLCLSRCYPSVHQWTLQESGPLQFVFISLSKSWERNTQKDVVEC